MYAKGQRLPAIAHFDRVSYDIGGGSGSIPRRNGHKSASDNLTRSRFSCLWIEEVSSGMNERYCSEVSAFEQPMFL